MSKFLRIALTQLVIAVCSAAAGHGPIASVAFGEPKKDPLSRTKASQAPAGQETQQYCANVAAAAGAARMAYQEKQLAELDRQLQKRLADLESKRAELQDLLDRYDAFVRKADEALVSVYARMKPDAAAAQLANLDEDSAAALLMQLKPKNSSAILNEMDAVRGAQLTKKIAAVSSMKRAGKKP
jgi:flagellar motility protein MotE (MotC chaperone)